MNDASKQLKLIITRLLEQRQHIDERIAALRLAVKALADDHGADTRRRRVGKVDRKGPQKTVQFLSARKRPASVTAVAKALSTTPEAASQRLAKLVAQGRVERVRRGMYRAATAGN